MIGSLFLTAIILIGPYIIYMLVLVSKFEFQFHLDIALFL